jgi:hypothetical protein
MINAYGTLVQAKLNNSQAVDGYNPVMVLFLLDINIYMKEKSKVLLYLVHRGRSRIKKHHAYHQAVFAGQ